MDGGLRSFPATVEGDRRRQDRDDLGSEEVLTDGRICLSTTAALPMDSTSAAESSASGDEAAGTRLVVADLDNGLDTRPSANCRASRRAISAMVSIGGVFVPVLVDVLGVSVTLEAPS